MTEDVDAIEAEERAEVDRESARLSANERRRDFLRLMGMAEGRRFFLRLLDDLSLFRPISCENATRIARRAAVRDYGLKLWDEARSLCPDLLTQAIKESDERKRSERTGA